MKKRETITVDKYILAVLIGRPQEDDDREEVDKEELKKYKFIEQDIDGVDEWDGGVDYTVIIERVTDNKFFKLEYQEWDIDWEKGDFENFPEELTEVFRKEVSLYIYE